MNESVASTEVYAISCCLQQFDKQKCIICLSKFSPTWEIFFFFLNYLCPSGFMWKTQIFLVESSVGFYCKIFATYQTEFGL